MPRRFLIIAFPVFTVVTGIFLDSLITIFAWERIREHDGYLFLPAFLFAGISCYFLRQLGRSAVAFHWFFWWGFVLLFTSLIQTLTIGRSLDGSSYDDILILSTSIPHILFLPANMGAAVVFMGIAVLGERQTPKRIS